jgi:hypothetical protein
MRTSELMVTPPASCAAAAEQLLAGAGAARRRRRRALAGSLGLSGTVTTEVALSDVVVVVVTETSCTDETLPPVAAAMAARSDAATPAALLSISSAPRPGSASTACAPAPAAAGMAPADADALALALTLRLCCGAAGVLLSLRRPRPRPRPSAMTTASEKKTASTRRWWRAADVLRVGSTPLPVCARAAFSANTGCADAAGALAAAEGILQEPCRATRAVRTFAMVGQTLGERSFCPAKNAESEAGATAAGTEKQFQKTFAFIHSSPACPCANA